MKKILLIGAVLLLAVLLVTPASAVWSNDNWIDSEHADEYFGNADVVTDNVTGVTSKYNPIVNTDPDRSIYGWVQFMLRSGGIGASLPGSQIVYVRNLKAIDVAPFNSSYYPDGTAFDNTNPNWTEIPILADGLSDIKDGLLPSGEFEACIADGNSGQPECQKFTIGNAQVTRVAFLGHAVSPDTPRRSRGNPADASIDAYLGNGDVHIDWIKIVKTGEHQYTPLCYDITVTDTPAWDETVVDSEAWDEIIPTTYKVVPCTHIIPAVPAVPAWTEYFGDYKTQGGHYEFVGVNAADYDVTFSYVAPTSSHGHTSHHGDYSQSGNHYNFVGSNNGDYVVQSHTEVGHTHHAATPAVPAHPEHAEGDTVVDVPEHTITHPASTHVVHHDAITHQQQVCPGPVTIPEYGFEYQIDITGAHVDLNNPNNEPVDVKFSFDLNYFVDLRPWDNRVDDGRIVPRIMTYDGQINNVGNGVTTYHGFLVPPVGNAVTVYDWSHGMQYFPTVSNAQVTATSWS